MEQMAQQQLQQMDAAASIASVASASKVGELFQYTVGNVNLPRQRSAMIPIVTDDLEVEKLSIYNQNVLAKHPLNGARVKNTTGKHLLQGPITVLEGASYAGDARIDNVPPGQERLISYGIDLQMLVDAKNHRSEETIVAGKIVKGVLWVTRKYVASQEYHAENKGDKDKTLVVEQPLRGAGWSLVQPEKAAEKTESLYRFRQTVAAGKPAVLKVVEENVAAQQIAILPTDVGTLELYAKTGRISKDVRDALIRAIAMKNAMTQTQRDIEQRRKEINDITQEQARIRENLKIDRTSQYADRLLKKLNDQETRIETLQKEVEELTKTMERQRKELEDYVAGTTVEDK